MTGTLRNTVLATVLAALLLAGCGGGNSDEQQIKTTVNSVFLDQNPAVCDNLVTANFLKSTYGKSHTKSLALCKKSQSAAKPAALSVAFNAVNVNKKKDHAIATVEITGGSLNGKTLTAVLVKTGKTWQFDTLQAAEAAPSDAQVRNTVDKALHEGLTTERGFSSKQADCFVNYLRSHVSDAQLAADLNALRRHQQAPDFAAATAKCK